MKMNPGQPMIGSTGGVRHPIRYVSVLTFRLRLVNNMQPLSTDPCLMTLGIGTEELCWGFMEFGFVL